MRKTNTSNSKVILASFLLALLSCQQVSATFFILGEGCVLGLNTALSLAGPELRRLGIDRAVDTIRGFCRSIVSFTAEGWMLEKLEPSLRDFVRFLASANLPTRLPELALRVNTLADNILDLQVDRNDDDDDDDNRRR